MRALGLAALEPEVPAPAEAIPDLEAGAVESPASPVFGNGTAPQGANILPAFDAAALESLGEGFGDDGATPQSAGMLPVDSAALESPAAPALDDGATLEPSRNLPEFDAATLEAVSEPALDDRAALEPSRNLPEFDAATLEAASEPAFYEGAVPEPSSALPELDPAALGATAEPTFDPSTLLAADSEPAEPSAVGAPEALQRLSLAERIDAAAETVDLGGVTQAEEPDGWGAIPVAPAAPQELGTPLDVADPANELGSAEEEGPIELSAADVVLLEAETGPESELTGNAEDPVPLASLHEFVGQQPADPRALAFDDEAGEPTFAPEDLQATEAELASAPESFLPEALDRELPLEAEPPAPPASPRISIPRPPPGPPPPRPVAAVAAASPQRTGQPPAGAYALSDDGRRLPAISPAAPEPPQLAHSFPGSGPFVRGKPVLLTQAPLDVMDDLAALEAEQPLPPPPPPTDVATGAEVFGGAYLSPTFVEGEHRVVLHTLEGQVRRGMVKDLDLLDPVIRLSQPGRPPEAIAAERVKAIFFMQEPGATALPSAGRRVRVGFSDGRQIVGFSEDVDAGEQGFFLIPADTRTHTARIYVFRAGIQSISAA